MIGDWEKHVSRVPEAMGVEDDSAVCNADDPQNATCTTTGMKAQAGIAKFFRTIEEKGTACEADLKEDK